LALRFRPTKKKAIDVNGVAVNGWGQSRRIERPAQI
jgi:hypothetical protein